MRSPCSRRALPQWHPRPSRAQATAHKTRALCVHAPPASGQVVEGILSYSPQNKKIVRPLSQESQPCCRRCGHCPYAAPVSVRGEDQSLRRVFPCALTLLLPRCTAARLVPRALPGVVDCDSVLRC